MSSGGAEAFKGALRRSLPLIVGLVLLGLVAVNALKQAQGPRYAASARVLVSTTPLSRILTDTQPTFTDPQRVQDTAQALATSPVIYRNAARGRRLGTPSELRAAITVSAETNNDILSFTASAASASKAVARVNAVAAAYTDFRGQLSRTTVSRAITQLRETLDGMAADSSDRAELERQLNRLRVLQSLNGGDAVLVDRAVAAGRTSPSPVKDSLLGLSLGLIIALVAVALREAVDTKVRSDSAVEEVLSAPVIGSVSSIPRGARLVTYGRHRAAFADAYALLAAQLAPESALGEPSQVLAVTSALSNEGKTTTSANLAVAIARRGQRVLVADFDFRKASLGDLFDVPGNAPGGLQVIDGTASVEECLWTVALGGDRPTLSRNGHSSESNGSNGHFFDGRLELLPAGGTVSNQDIPQVQDMARLLRDLRHRADVVILDTPAALVTVELTELSRLVDLVVVVVREGYTTQRTLRALSRQVRSWEAAVAGAVLTDTEVEGNEFMPYGARAYGAR